MPGSWKRLRLLACAVSLGAILALAAQQPAPQPQPQPILTYIKQTWSVLTRSDAGLAKAAPDPKFHPMPDGRWPVYIPANEDHARIEAALKRDMAPGDFQTIAILPLPPDPAKIREHGLLYIPRPYVVPGGRFNEMYGWDSYFIQVGLLRDGRVELAKDMADNFIYEIRNYGKILNANRTYYMGRSQPPFLTQMLLGVYERTHDKKWLADALPEVEKYYRFWTTAPHFTPQTGLSRYYDMFDGPAPEALAAEHDAQGRSHYDLVAEYYRTHQVKDYDESQYYNAKTGKLTALFYKGDRSMRESGFDPSNRFGPFNADIIHYDPVCLNSLLYIMETQTGDILRILERAGDAAVWDKRARERAATMKRLMWDEHDGLYYDYNFVNNKIRKYPFLTAYYPMWAGFATKEQAKRLVENLARFERPGGLMNSSTVTGEQWDAPYGWAPTEMIALQALRRYGYHKDADRISVKFLSLIEEQYRLSGTIVEKYDVVRRSTDVSGIKFGYSANQAGFGWTNAAFTDLLDALPAEERTKVLAH